MKRQSNEPGSLLMLIASMFIYGTIGIFRRYIPISSGLLAFIRGVVGSIFLLCVMLVKKRKVIPAVGKRSMILLALSGALIGFNWIFLFESYNYTSVATATLCYYLAPSIVMLVSPLLFKERLTIKKQFCVIASFIGMVLASGMIQTGLPTFREFKGILFGIGAAVFYSVIVILNKKLADIEPLSKTFIQLCSSAVVILPYVLIAEDITLMPTDTRSLVLTAILGIVHTGIAYTLYFASIDGLKTQTTAIFSYVDPVTALLLSFFILNEKMSLPALIGAVLMIGSAIFSVVESKPGIHKDTFS